MKTGTRVKVVGYDLSVGMRKKYPLRLGEEGVVERSESKVQERGEDLVLVRLHSGFGAWLFPSEIEPTR